MTGWMWSLLPVFALYQLIRLIFFVTYAS